MLAEGRTDMDVHVDMSDRVELMDRRTAAASNKNMGRGGGGSGAAEGPGGPHPTANPLTAGMPVGVI